MKTLKFIQIITICFFLIAAISFTSCKKDKEKSTTIVGTWTVKSYVITNFENGGTSIDDTKNQTPRPTFEFNADGTFINTLEVTPQSTTYTLSGNKVQFAENIAFEQNSFDYNINGSTLLLTRSDTFNGTSGNYTENTTIILERK